MRGTHGSVSGTRNSSYSDDFEWGRSVSRLCMLKCTEIPVRNRRNILHSPEYLHRQPTCCSSKYVQETTRTMRRWYISLSFVAAPELFSDKTMTMDLKQYPPGKRESPVDLLGPPDFCHLERTIFQGTKDSQNSARKIPRFHFRSIFRFTGDPRECENRQIGDISAFVSALQEIDQLRRSVGSE